MNNVLAGINYLRVMCLNKALLLGMKCWQWACSYRVPLNYRKLLGHSRLINYPQMDHL